MSRLIMPFTAAQMHSLWINSPERHGDCKSFAAFERVARLVERAHRIDGVAQPRALLTGEPDIEVPAPVFKP